MTLNTRVPYTMLDSSEAGLRQKHHIEFVRPTNQGVPVMQFCMAMILGQLQACSAAMIHCVQIKIL